MSTKKKRTSRSPRNAMDATRCPHCSEQRLVASVADFQMLNYEYPLPGMYAFLRTAERAVGADGLLIACVPCGCFQPVGVYGASALSHAHAA
jgi:hypothetical protein